MAAEDINANGGILGREMEIVTADTHMFETEIAAAAFEKLITKDKVDAIVTYYASFSLFEMDVVEKYNIPYICLSTPTAFWDILKTDPDGYRMSWNVQPYPPNIPEGAVSVMNDLWEQDMFPIKNRKVSLISSSDAWGSMLAGFFRDELAKYDWTINVDEEVPWGEEAEWGTILAKIRADPPSMIVVTDWITSNNVSLWKQFLEKPINSLVFIQRSGSAYEYVELLGELQVGLLGAVAIGVIPNEQGEAFNQRFWDRYGIGVDTAFPVALYDEEHIIAEAMTKAGDIDDHDAVAEALSKTDYTGLCGRYVFDERHIAIYGKDYIPSPVYQTYDPTGKKLPAVIGPYYKTRDFEMPPWIK
jgi:branched-chain amino acid transport system substrate-binding protein